MKQLTIGTRVSLLRNDKLYIVVGYAPALAKCYTLECKGTTIHASHNEIKEEKAITQ